MRCARAFYTVGNGTFPVATVSFVSARVSAHTHANARYCYCPCNFRHYICLFQSFVIEMLSLCRYFEITTLHCIRLTAFFPGQPRSAGTRKVTILDFNEARDDGVAVASAGPSANHLHLAPDR